MRELSKTTPTLIPPKHWIITKNTRQLSRKWVVNDIFIILMPIYPYQEQAIEQKITNKREKTSRKIRRAYANWNGWKLQLYWIKLDG